MVIIQFNTLHMVTYLMQSVSDEATADIGVYSRELFNQLLGVDIMLLFRMLAIWMFFIWVVFALWVAFDASSRYRNWYTALLWFLFVLPGNVLGFIGYLFMRPVVTLEEKQWTKLEGKYLMQELSNINDCPTCGTLVNATQNFCSACGMQMNVKCPQCEKYQSIYNVYCGDCGTQLQEQTVVAKHTFNKDEMQKDAQQIEQSGEPQKSSKIGLFASVGNLFSNALASVKRKPVAVDTKPVTPESEKQSKKSNKKK